MTAITCEVVCIYCFIRYEFLSSDDALGYMMLVGWDPVCLSTDLVNPRSFSTARNFAALSFFTKALSA